MFNVFQEKFLTLLEAMTPNKRSLGLSNLYAFAATTKDPSAKDESFMVNHKSQMWNTLWPSLVRMHKELEKLGVGKLEH